MLRSGGLEADGDAAKQCVVRACCSKGDADACGGLGDACGDFEEARAQGGELGVGERMRFVDGVAHRQHQPVGGGMQHETHLIGECRATTGPIGGKLALVQLDQVLGLAARAVERSVKSLAGLSAMFAPILKGWQQYHGRFHGSALKPVWQNMNLFLTRWLMRKYKG